MLEGSLPPDDAFLVRKLREAGAVVLAKVNLSELASGGPLSSLGGPTLNPHDLTRSASGSSGGSGVAVAAAFAQLGLGTDTGGSVRGPSTANGIVGLKTTHGLLSRDGVIPLGLSFDTVGPMARHVADVATVLGVLAGVDPADPSTLQGEGRAHSDYTTFLNGGALDGARLGIARDFLGQDDEVDWVIEAALEAMRKAGATVVDVSLPGWLLQVNSDFYTTIRHREFRAQIPAYLATLDARYPKTLEELVKGSQLLVAPAGGAQPNPSRWSLLAREENSGEITDAEYVAMRDHGLALVRGIVAGLFDAHQLDAIVFPTSARRPERIDVEGDGFGDDGHSPIRFANLTGFPELTVPAGFTSNLLPVGVSFLGRAFDELKLLALGYAFEQRTRARRLPVHTPPLAGESLAAPPVP
jgi:amidase